MPLGTPPHHVLAVWPSEVVIESRSTLVSPSSRAEVRPIMIVSFTTAHAGGAVISMFSTMFSQLAFGPLHLLSSHLLALEVVRLFIERVLRLNNSRSLALPHLLYCLELRPLSLLLFP